MRQPNLLTRAQLAKRSPGTSYSRYVNYVTRTRAARATARRNQLGPFAPFVQTPQAWAQQAAKAYPVRPPSYYQGLAAKTYPIRPESYYRGLAEKTYPTQPASYWQGLAEKTYPMQPMDYWTNLAAQTYPLMSADEMSSRAKSMVSASIDPVIAQITASNTAATKAGIDQISAYAQGAAKDLGSIAPEIGAAYDASIKQQGAIDQSLAEYMKGAGASAAQSVGAQMQAIGAGPESAASLTALGAGAGGEIAGLGSASQSQLAANRAANVAYGNLYPGFAQLTGQQQVGQYTTKQAQALSEQIGSLEAQVPGMTQSMIQNFMSQNQAAREGRAGLLQTGMSAAQAARAGRAEITMAGLTAAQEAQANRAQILREGLSAQDAARANRAQILASGLSAADTARANRATMRQAGLTQALQAATAYQGLLSDKKQRELAWRQSQLGATTDITTTAMGQAGATRRERMSNQAAMDRLEKQIGTGAYSGSAKNPLSRLGTFTNQLAGKVAGASWRGRQVTVNSPRNPALVSHWEKRGGTWKPIGKDGKPLPQTLLTQKVNLPVPNEQAYNMILNSLRAQYGGTIEAKLKPKQALAWYAQQIAAIAQQGGYARADPQQILQTLANTRARAAGSVVAPVAKTTTPATPQQKIAVKISTDNTRRDTYNTAMSWSRSGVTPARAYQYLYRELAKTMPVEGARAMAREQVLAAYPAGTSLKGVQAIPAGPTKLGPAPKVDPNALAGGVPGVGPGKIQAQPGAGSLPKGAKIVATVHRPSGQIIVRLTDGRMFTRGKKEKFWSPYTSAKPLY